jgi:hypothetical protein
VSGGAGGARPAKTRVSQVDEADHLLLRSASKESDGPFRLGGGINTLRIHDLVG